MKEQILKQGTGLQSLPSLLDEKKYFFTYVCKIQ